VSDLRRHDHDRNPPSKPLFAAPALTKLLVNFGATVAQAGLEPSLVELVKIRASQINGCAICLKMHTHEARKRGETEERLLMLNAWREARSLYSERERAALGWTEAVTRLAQTHAPDEDYEALEAHFTDEEQVKLTLVISVINAFNHLGVGFRVDPGLLAQLTRAAA
jgi:AhpD family alkylhydroperoxidase